MVKKNDKQYCQRSFVKVLLTSGGTKTAIDSVRSVTNMSSGTFGKHLCRAFLERGDDVTFLYAKGSKCPHEFRIDLSPVLWPKGYASAKNDLAMEDLLKDIRSDLNFLEENKHLYSPLEYSDFEKYSQMLTELLFSLKPDVVVLAAAVSDYAPVKMDGKIRSDHPELNIKLIQTPKLIRQVKQILPDCFLVGFKLLVNSTQRQLEDAMIDQMCKTKADFVVGNDLRDIKASNHKLTILSIDNQFYEFGPMSGNKLAEELVRQIVQDKETLNRAIAENKK